MGFQLVAECGIDGFRAMELATKTTKVHEKARKVER
jgi:hypothetical protein